MKKILLLGLAPLLILPTTVVVSCSSDLGPGNKVMAWALSQTKVNEIAKGDWNAFNNEPITLDKLIKVINGDGSELSRYTTNAMAEGWFEKISFEVNNNNVPTKLVVSLKDKINNKNCPYRLPNGSMSMSISVKLN